MLNFPYLINFIFENLSIILSSLEYHCFLIIRYVFRILNLIIEDVERKKKGKMVI